jgi:lysophospholipase L1-like esterase
MQSGSFQLRDERLLGAYRHAKRRGQPTDDGFFAACKPYEYGSARFLKAWTRAAKKTQRMLSVHRARFFWVLAPSLRDTPKVPMVPKINAIYRSLGPSIDAWTAFGGASFDQSLRFDNEHLNEAGAQRISDLVVHSVG